MRASLLCCVLALSGSYVTALEQPPEVPKTNEQKSSTKEEKRGTEKSPLVINVKSLPDPSEKVQADQAAERREHTNTDRWLILLTGLICIANFLLWFATRKLARDAKESDRATERAYLFIEFPAVPRMDDSISLQGAFNVGIANYGKTPAEIVRIRGYPAVRAEIPQALIEFEGSDAELPPGLGIRSNDSYPVPIEYMLTEDQRREMENWNTTLFLVGCVNYKDMFGGTWETSFCWNLLIHGVKARFVPTRNSPLNRRT